jgi:AraC-like DNA-binding protein
MQARSKLTIILHRCGRSICRWVEIEMMLSDLLYGIELIHGDFALLELRRGGGFLLPPRKELMLHLVLRGKARFRYAESGHDISALAGEYFFTALNLEQRITAVGEDCATTQVDPFKEADQPTLLSSGSDAEVAMVLTGKLRTDTARYETVMKILPGLRADRRNFPPTRFDARQILSIEGLQAAASGSGANALLLRIAELLLVMAIRQTLAARERAGVDDEIIDIPQIGTALRLMYEDLQKTWTVAKLAKAVGMSRSVFASTFTRETGETPIHYLTRARMLRAAQLIEDGRRSLPEIAHLAGYVSEAGFTRAFRREFGKTPGTYRRSSSRHRQ